ncbi:hypothetical protein JOD49_000459 [Oerskovia jenensis]|uniref:Uncharacterized protein n=1 Tax=Oerskovia jenensis TaxID=162169 RepID=A0ABS2LCL7_9CELL|nr:hypothetical protein [Oerskovia jenensis]
MEVVFRAETTSIPFSTAAGDGAGDGRGQCETFG